MKRVLVTGGRQFAARELLCKRLDDLWLSRGPFGLLIEGGATGADRMAREWAKSRGVPVLTVEPKYSMFGKSAPIKRNQEMVSMLDDGDIVVAFEGGTGTADCVKRAERRGLEVISWGMQDGS